MDQAVAQALFQNFKTSKIPQAVEFKVLDGTVTLEMNRVIPNFSVKTNDNQFMEVPIITIHSVFVSENIRRRGVFHAIVKALLEHPDNSCWHGNPPNAVMIEAVINEGFRNALHANSQYISQAWDDDCPNPSFVRFSDK
jgi:hypothetical protein